MIDIEWKMPDDVVSRVPRCRVTLGAGWPGVKGRMAAEGTLAGVVGGMQAVTSAVARSH